MLLPGLIKVGEEDLESKLCFKRKEVFEKPWADLAAGSPDGSTYFKLFTYFLLDVWLLRFKVWQ